MLTNNYGDFEVPVVNLCKIETQILRSQRAFHLIFYLNTFLDTF